MNRNILLDMTQNALGNVFLHLRSLKNVHFGKF
jgi:hypothetical protein